MALVVVHKTWHSIDVLVPPVGLVALTLGSGPTQLFRELMILEDEVVGELVQLTPLLVCADLLGSYSCLRELPLAPMMLSGMGRTLDSKICILGTLVILSCLPTRLMLI